MSEVQERHTKLVNTMTKIKDIIISHEKGEIYISWKGSALFIKETHIVDIEDSALTSQEK